MVEYQARNETLRRWTISHLKAEIQKMTKMDRIELHEYKRVNNLGFYKGGISHLPGTNVTVTSGFV